jgi:uncharacterized protein
MVFGVSFSIFAVTSFIAYKYRFFALGQEKLEGRVSNRDLFGAFLCFLGTHLLAAQGAIILWMRAGYSNTESVAFQGWVSVFSMISAACVLVVYTYLVIDHPTRLSICSPNETDKFSAFCYGMLALTIGYPMVIALGQFIRMVQYFLFVTPEIDQVAVQAIKKSMQVPNLFLVMILCVIVIVPVAEELLFRGYLQGWFRHYFNSKTAIILTSFIFASFHYSAQQGFSNLELLFSLFALSILLGLLYEKKRTLWAPIGLHIAFNAVNVILLFQSAV